MDLASVTSLLGYHRGMLTDDKGVFVMLDAAAPTRLFSGLPEGVTLERVGLVEALEQTELFLHGQRE